MHINKAQKKFVTLKAYIRKEEMLRSMKQINKVPKYKVDTQK